MTDHPNDPIANRPDDQPDHTGVAPDGAWRHDPTPPLAAGPEPRVDRPMPELAAGLHAEIPAPGPGYWDRIDVTLQGIDAGQGGAGPADPLIGFDDIESDADADVVRLTAMNDSTGAHPSNWSPRLRLVAIAAAALVLLGGLATYAGLRNDDSGDPVIAAGDDTGDNDGAALQPTPTAGPTVAPTVVEGRRFGPMAVVDLASGRDARAEGVIYAGRDCVTLDGDTLLVWSRSTTWARADGWIDSEGTIVRSGDRVVLGGHGTSLTPAELEAIDWVQPPAESCLGDESTGVWFVNGVTVKKGGPLTRAACPADIGHPRADARTLLTDAQAESLQLGADCVRSEQVGAPSFDEATSTLTVMYSVYRGPGADCEQVYAVTIDEENGAISVYTVNENRDTAQCMIGEGFGIEIDVMVPAELAATVARFVGPGGFFQGGGGAGDDG